MGVDPHDPKLTNATNQSKHTEQISEQVLRLSKMGFDACWLGGEQELHRFIVRVLDPFEENTSRQERCDTIQALARILDTFRSDLEDSDYRAGLAKALNCVRRVLVSDFDFATAPSEDLNTLSSALLSILQHERFVPAAVLAGDDRTCLETAQVALSCLFWCHEYTPEATLPANTTRESLGGLIREGLEVAAKQVQAREPANEPSEFDELRLAFIRDWANAALYFPSSELSGPLLALARVSAELAEEAHLFFPDVEPPGKEYDSDDEYEDDDDQDPLNDDDLNEEDATSEINGVDVTSTDGETWRASMEIDDPSGEFETVTAACFSALAFCQDGERLVPIWKHMLNKLDLEDIEWTSALVGLSRIDADEIQIYLIDLFDQITQKEPDEFIRETKQETATNAVLELMAGNESAGVQVKQVFDRCAPADKKSIAARFQQTLDDGDALMLVSNGNRQKSLEEQVSWAFGLHNS
jgi:hypothetical protein